jgi:hypothetical protein
LRNGEYDVQMELLSCIMEYQDLKQRVRTVVDARDQLEVLQKIWHHRPDLIQSEYNHILVDDLQDCR